MDRFVSLPVALTASQTAGAYKRADLVFYEVDASGPSFIARVFLDGGEAQPDNLPSREVGYAGFFTIFGHGGCFGDAGHCEVPAHRDPFDVGPPHALTPQTRMVDITKRLREIKNGPITITVLPITRARSGPQLIDALIFSGLRLLSYS
jgi:hypothetical protein